VTTVIVLGTGVAVLAAIYLVLSAVVYRRYQGTRFVTCPERPHPKTLSCG
jgi:hypothetical protein